MLTRRVFFGGCAALLGATMLRGDEREPRPLGFGFSLYGMKNLPLEEALRACAEIGYDCVELPVMEAWPADALAWPVEQQERFRRTLDETGLRLAAIMENLSLVADDERHAANLKRLAAAGQVAHRVAPTGPHIIETVLGGRPEQWSQVKDLMAKRLRDWAKVAEDDDFTLAIKAHVGGALHTPEDAVWLGSQANSERVKCAYDYSHFQLRGMDLAASLQTLAPHSVFMHVKDAQGDAARPQFLLPGDGATDYARLLQLAVAAGYRGDVVVEVSGQIHGRADYQPLAAARRCYEKLAPAFERAGVTRT
jgi:inosose dehydratase